MYVSRLILKDMSKVSKEPSEDIDTNFRSKAFTRCATDHYSSQTL